MRMLLIGGEGQLGSDILRNNTCHQILAPTHAKLDVQLRENVESFVHQFSPEIIVNCAAFHNVPNCEFAPELAFRINCIAVRDLAEICRKLDIPLVTFSSDYVFGGDQRKPYGEASCPAPVQVYGMTRLAGEHAARALAPNHAVIVRTCGLYGMAVSRSKGGNFVDQRIAEARVNEQIEISCEQIVSPTSSDDLSKAVLGLIEHSE
ncbi:MAG: sugar nucleotide-binding protein, partial [Burkholderiales bacterium]|nr:sugar nucleotide-binding protein [Burkholderiales bacterium]